MLEITPLSLTDLDGPDASTHRGVLSVSRAAVIDAIGDDDFAMRPHDMLFALTPIEDTVNFITAGLIDGQVVGYTEGEASLRDNLTQCEIGVTVHPDWRRQGIGSQLLDWARGWAADLGRTTQISWVLAPPISDDTPTVTAPTGDDFAADRPGWLFAAHHGFTLEQIERVSNLPLPMPNRQQLFDDAQAHAAGYRLLVWQGDIPPQWLDDFAALRARVTIDVPMANIETEEEVWDADRLTRNWQKVRSLGFQRLLVVAEDIASGHLVAFTQLSWHPDNPRCAYQGYTFVRGDHRGHRLGMLVKTAALQHLAVVNPTADHVQTDNASENSWMLAINHAMGFKLSSLMAFVQSKPD